MSSEERALTGTAAIEGRITDGRDRDSGAQTSRRGSKGGSGRIRGSSLVWSGWGVVLEVLVVMEEGGSRQRRRLGGSDPGECSRERGATASW